MHPIILILAGAFAVADDASIKTFDLTSRDGVVVHGEADLPNAHPRGAVIFSAGSGAHDRDMLFGRSGSPRDKIFKDLAERMERRGLAAVRYDKRGVIFVNTAARASDAVTNPPASAARDKKLSASVTTQTQVDDLKAVYDWTLSEKGLGAACVVILAHSEGMANAGALAEQGAPTPSLVIGMGGLTESKQGVLRWQMTERTADGLQEMDANHDGVITNAEIEANWRQTVLGDLESPTSLLSPSGRWTSGDLDAQREKDSAAYEAAKNAAYTVPDATPWPDAATSAASFQWWKSWFTDDRPIAAKIRAWKTHFIFHYGTIDSQTNVARQVDAINRYLPPGMVKIIMHPGRGHSLGENSLFGPIDEKIADEVADEAQAACTPTARVP